MSEQPKGKTYVGSYELYADVQRCMQLVAEMNGGVSARVIRMIKSKE